MEKLKEDYISIDTRLEYMEAIAVKYVPDIDIDPATVYGLANPTSIK